MALLKANPLAIAQAMKRRSERSKGAMIEDSAEPVSSHSSIAEAILKRRKMAAGGEIEAEDNDSDAFLSADMASSEPDDLTYPDDDNTEHEIEDPIQKRRQTLSSIISGLHSKHYGK